MNVARWTISDQSSPHRKLCLSVLKMSIKSFHKIQPNFKKYVCYNNIDFDKIKFLEKYGVIFLDQKKYLGEININPYDSFWKYFPPRININVHEIFIDNDIIFHKNFLELENFLKNSNNIIFTSGHKKFYGQFSKFIKKQIILNTGFFGLPPFFNFKEEINKILNQTSIKEIKTHFDDQGLFCMILENNKYIKIPIKVFNVCNSNLDFSKFELGIAATHFSGINRKNFLFFKKFISDKLL